jgi:type II secretory pathway pseudopilin PulG
MGHVEDAMTGEGTGPSSDDRAKRAALWSLTALATVVTLILLAGVGVIAWRAWSEYDARRQAQIDEEVARQQEAALDRAIDTYRRECQRAIKTQQWPVLVAGDKYETADFNTENGIGSATCELELLKTARWLYQHPYSSTWCSDRHPGRSECFPLEPFTAP